MSDSLELALGGPTKEITMNGKAVELVPMKMKQLVAFAKAIKPIRGELAALTGDLTFENLANLLAAGTGDDLFKAVEVATGVDRATLETLDLAEFIELAGAALSVNADFFVKKVAPAIQETVTGST